MKCKYCGQDGFEDKTSLMRHVRWDCTEKPKSKKKHVTTKAKPVTTTEQATGSDVFEDAYQEMASEVKFLQMQQRLEMLKSGFSGKKESSSDDGKIVMVIDGISMSLSPQEALGWKKYLMDQKKEEEERKERISRKESDVINELRKENVELRKDMFAFQNQLLQGQMQHDPVGDFINLKSKLEGLGIGSRKNATDQMYSMDIKKLDTLLTIVLEKSQGKTPKFDRLLDAVGPLGKNYLQEMIVNMKAMRGGGTIPESKRTDKEYDDIYKKLSKMSPKDLQELEDSLGPEQEIPPGSKNNISMEPPKKAIDEIPVVEGPPKKVISIPPKKKTTKEKVK